MDEPPYTCERDNADSRFESNEGAIRAMARRIRRGLGLDDVYLTRANKLALDQLQASREEFCVSPPWKDGVDVLTYLPLQKTLSDMLHKDVRSAITFTRKCQKASAISGKWFGLDESVYGTAPFGMGLHVTDPSQYLDYVSFEDKVYMTADASDNASTDTTLTFKNAAAIERFYVGQYVMVSTEGLATNVWEPAIIDSVSSNKMDVTLTTGSTNLGNTSSFTVAQRAYVTNNLFSDGLLEDSGTGSITNFNTPSLVEKNKTMQETGTQCLRVIGGSDNDGIEQDFGDYPAGLELFVIARVKVIRGTMRFQVINTTNAYAPLAHNPSAATWTWIRYSASVRQSVGTQGSGQKAMHMRFFQTGATEAEYLIDRIEVYQNFVPNGSFEGTYTTGDPDAPDEIAPSWGSQATESGDDFTKSASEHGGASAQGIDVEEAAEGIKTDSASVYDDATWYWTGCHLKVTSGVATMNMSVDGDVGGGVTANEWTLISECLLTTGSQRIKIMSDGGAANFLVDDCFAVKIPGNPFDDAYYDLPEPLSTDGYTIFWTWMPDVANTGYDQDAAIWTIARRVFASSDRVYSTYDESATTMVFSNTSTASGNDQSNIASTTFNAKDKMFFAMKVDGGTGAMKSWRKNGTGATSTGSGAGATIAAGLTRLWFRSGSGAEFHLSSRGTAACFIVVNEVMSDADIEAILDMFSGVDADVLALQEETHGVLYRVAPGGVDVEPWQSDKFHGQVGLVEVDRVGVRTALP